MITNFPSRNDIRIRARTALRRNIPSGSCPARAGHSKASFVIPFTPSGRDRGRGRLVPAAVPLQLRWNENSRRSSIAVIRIGRGARAAAGPWIRRRLEEVSAPGKRRSGDYAHCDLCGISLRLCDREPWGCADRGRSRGRFYGLAFVHAARDRGRIEELVRIAIRQYGFVGIKVHRHDARLSREICDVARFSVPILYDPVGEVSIIELVATEYPDVAFIIPHMGSFSDVGAHNTG